MTFWFIDIRGNGLFDRVFTWPAGVINRHSTVFANICEISQPQGEPLDFPFQGSATMQIYNIVPRDDGSVSIRIGVDWDSDLNVRLRFGVET